MRVTLKSITIFVALLTGIFAFVPTKARGGAAEAFTTAPTAVIPLVDSLTRLDMIDYYRAGLTTMSRNNLGEESRLIALGEDSVVLKLSEKVTQAIYLLPLKNDTIYAVVKTYKLPALDSSIKFYDSEWNQIDTNRIITLPGRENWLIKSNRESKAKLAENLTFVTAAITIDVAAGELTFTNTLADLLPLESMEAVKDDIKPRLVYTWNRSKGSFKPVQQ